MRSLWLCLLPLALACAPALAAPAYTPLEKRFSPEQFEQTGLDQLTPAQLALLNALLSEQHTEVVQHTDREARRAPRIIEPVSSQIVGSIRGWSNGTVLTLANGQQWRVVQGDLFLRKPLENVDVEIAPSAMGAWMLQIPGQNQRAKVERVD